MITDASGYGLGAMLVQMDAAGVERVVCYAGRPLTEAEKRYTTGERELLAVKWAVKKFRCYLYGTLFSVYTDHRPIIHLKTSRNPSDRMLKWILELEEYNVTYYYRPGKFNVPADVLSRLDEPDHEPQSWYARKKSVEKLEAEHSGNLSNTAHMSFKSDSEVEEVMAVVEQETPFVVVPDYQILPELYNKASLTVAQQEDPAIRHLLERLPDWSDSGKGKAFKQDAEGTLYLVDLLSKQWRIVIPASYRKHVLKACHDDLGGSHLGRTKTLNKVSSRFFWQGLSRDVREYVSACKTCCSTKTSRAPTKPALVALPPVYNPFDRIAVDFVGPLPITKDGNRYILVFVDYATRWPEAFATPDMKATTVAELFVREILCRHGAPVCLLSDQGRDFLAAVLKEVLTFTRTSKIQTAAYHPQTNGLCERFNGTLMSMLSAYVHSNQDNWDRLLPMALFGYRTAVQESTNFAPAELLYARQIRLPMNLDLFTPKLDFARKVKECFRRAQSGVMKTAERNKKRQLGANKPRTYSAGDQVRVRAMATATGLSKKLKGDKWSDPTRVLAVKGSNVLLKLNRDTSWVNVERVKPAENQISF